MPDTTARKSPTLRQALERFRVGHAALKKQRAREQADLEFQVPERQWPEDLQRFRRPQIVNGMHLPGRPMLSIPTLEQPIALSENQERAANLGVNVHALSEDATDDTAEVLEGLYRSIEVDSRAGLARSWAFQRALRAGLGVYRVMTVWDQTSNVPGDQKIVIKRVLHQEAWVPDPFAEEPDWSDRRWDFLVSWLPWDVFRERYPHSKLSGYGDDELLAEALISPEWIKTDQESRAVLVAEYWRVETTPQLDQPDLRRVFWSTICAVEELEPEQEWNGHYIPNIPVIGRELLPFDAERRWVGMYSANKDAARLVNYAASNAVEIASLEPKAQFDVDPAEIQGLEHWWEMANVANLPYLPRHKFAANGQPYGPLQRIQADLSRLGPSMSLLAMGKDFVHIGTGAYQPSLGEESKAKSGRQVLALQQQHEQGNSHWLDNLAEISLTYEAKVILDLIPAVYDRPGRVERILDLEGQKRTVMLNCPFIGGTRSQRPQAVSLDPSTGQPMLPEGCDASQVKHYDLSKGRYGVTVSVGKAYKSRLEEGADALSTLFQAEPELFRLLGDLWLGFQSWPGHKEAQERMKRLLPSPLQPQDQQPDAGQQLQQATAVIQQLQQQLAQMAEELKTDRAKAEAQFATKQLETDAKLRSEEMRNATQIAIAHINAAAKGAAIDTHAVEEALALGHAAQQADLDRAHEVAMAAMPPRGNGQPEEDS